MSAGELIPQVLELDCSDRLAWGQPSALYSYIFKNNADPAKYPKDACPPYYHSNFQVDNIQLNQTMVAGGTVTAPTFIGNLIGRASGNKTFDIPHPSKEGWRLRHTCLEGPENGVYVRGRLTNSNVIELPDYWIKLVDAESITVSLTQIGYSQDLIVEKIEWGKNILIKSGTGANIDCYYVVNGTRKNTETLIPEYEGTTPADYPGDNSQYSVAGFHYDVRPS
jgi:hypothetical protein